MELGIWYRTNEKEVNGRLSININFNPAIDNRLNIVTLSSKENFKIQKIA